MYQCSKCLELVKNRSELAYHKQNDCIFRKPPSDVPLEKQKYICDFENCNKEFDTQRQFTRHKRRHMLLYSCDICNKKLSSGWELKIHKRTHNGNKCERCPYCNQSFVDPSSKRRHIQSYHNGDKKQFCCHICKRPFARYVMCCFFFFLLLFHLMCGICYFCF